VSLLNRYINIVTERFQDELIGWGVEWTLEVADLKSYWLLIPFSKLAYNTIFKIGFYTIILTVFHVKEITQCYFRVRCNWENKCVRGTKRCTLQITPNTPKWLANEISWNRLRSSYSYELFKLFAHPWAYVNIWVMICFLLSDQEWMQIELLRLQKRLFRSWLFYCNTELEYNFAMEFYLYCLIV